MGAKPSNNLKTDRPESGGADHGGIREKSGLTERDKNAYAAAEQKRQQEYREEHDREEGRAVTADRSTDETPPARGKGA